MRNEKKIEKNASKAIDHIINDEDDIVTLLSNDGSEIDFIEIAGLYYKGNFYSVLQPVELLEGMSDDEALVFKVTKDSRGEDNFEIELDETIIEAVFEEYQKLLADMDAKNEDE